jgi:AraC-like DNA-binding protein
MTTGDLRPLDEQIYDFLSSTSMSNDAIAKRLGIAPSTVASHSKKMVEKFNMNPSIVRTSRRTRMFGRYCQNLICHELCYFSEAEIKSGPPFYCSPLCKKNAHIIPPTLNQIQSLYKKNSFQEIADEFGMSLGSLARIFEHHNIEPIDFPENVLVTPANIAQRQTQRIRQRRSSFSNTRSGFREHLGFTVRSSWENNFCLYLNHKKIRFEYEPKVFYYPEKTGAKSYLPDFKLNVRGKEVWVEVKGRMMSKDRTKMMRLKKHYPDVFSKMTFVVQKPGCDGDISYKKLGLKPFLYYNDLEQEFGHILKHWES